MTTADKLQDLRERLDKAQDPGSERSRKRRSTHAPTLLMVTSNPAPSSAPCTAPENWPAKASYPISCAFARASPSKEKPARALFTTVSSRPNASTAVCARAAAASGSERSATTTRARLPRSATSAATLGS